MNTVLINNWNEKVMPSDTIYILGDFAWKNPKPFIEHLNGSKIFIPGGHDKQIKGDKLLEVKINDVWFILCHYPLYSWNKEYYGSIHLHGHIHNSLIDYKDNRINVGVDVWNYYPVSIKQILDISNI